MKKIIFSFLMCAGTMVSLNAQDNVKKTVAIAAPKGAPANLPSYNSQTYEPIANAQKGSEVSVSELKWQTYSYSKLPFTFEYPTSWIKNGEEVDIINRKGEVMAISVSFTDTVLNSFFSVEYHVAPYGAELYEYTKNDFNSSNDSSATSRKQIKVADGNAFEVSSVMSMDIKGNIYNPPLRLIYVTFLDKQQAGEFELQFRTPAPNDIEEVAKFRKLLSTIKLHN